MNCNGKTCKCGASYSTDEVLDAVVNCKERFKIVDKDAIYYILSCPKCPKRKIVIEITEENYQGLKDSYILSVLCDAYEKYTENLSLYHGLKSIGFE